MELPFIGMFGYEDRPLPRQRQRPCRMRQNESNCNRRVNRHRTPQQIALRASIILLADEGKITLEIARALNISRDSGAVA